MVPAMRAFVAEQYLPAGSAELAACGAGAARLAAEQLTGEGTAVRFVGSIFVPEDETCIHLYFADSIEAVYAVALRAALGIERVAEAVSCSGAADERQDDDWQGA
jgi:hypothetical protein